MFIKKQLLIIAIFCSVFTLGFKINDEIIIPEKRIDYNDDSLYLEGNWSQISGSKGIIPEINFTMLVCERKIKTCNEFNSKLLKKNETRINNDAMLWGDTFEYEIVEWSGSMLRAVRRASVADIEIRISLADKFAEKSFRETKARGSETANPDFHGKWVLK